MIRTIISLIFIPFIAAFVVFAGCSAQRTSIAPSNNSYASKKFYAPLGQKLEVNTGEELFLEGTYIEGEEILIPEPLDIMIPGSMMIPFPVHIDAGRLSLSRIESSWKYYCAEEGKAAASFPGLGSVIRQGDCVGIRVSSDGTKKEWVVDNSKYNKMETIWHKSVGQDDKALYTPKPSRRPFKVQSLKSIIFDGYHGGQLHFTWEEIAEGSRESREFKFDFEGKPTLIGIRGNQFNAISADNVRLFYEWVAFK